MTDIGQNFCIDFSLWCECREERIDINCVFNIVERPHGREAIANILREVVRQHYVSPNTLTQDFVELGYVGTSQLLSFQLPETPRARSGDLGEIIATEFVDAQGEYHVPIRRLRYKDGREMAMRGDDLIAVRHNGGRLAYLKGEVKSRARLSAHVVREAREALLRNSGRPNAHSLLFIADRLLEASIDSDRTLGRLIRNHIVRESTPDELIQHMIFVLSGREDGHLLVEDILFYRGDIKQSSVCFTVDKHTEFINMAYEGALAIGDS